MLLDYHDDVAKEIAKRRADEVDKLIAAEGNSRHDLIRGRISAFDDASHALRDILALYSKDETEPAPARGPRERVLRDYRGRARA